MSKSKIGQSIHTTRSPETARERLDTTIKYPQVSSAPPPGTPKAILDTMNHPHYRSLVEDLKELGLADPNMPEDETNWKIDVVCSAREEIRLARQRLGPPPADNCGAAMKDYLKCFSQPKTGLSGTLAAAGKWNLSFTPRLISTETPSPSISSSSSSRSTGSTAPSSVDSASHDIGTPRASSQKETGTCRSHACGGLFGMSQPLASACRGRIARSQPPSLSDKQQMSDQGVEGGFSQDMDYVYLPVKAGDPDVLDHDCNLPGVAAWEVNQFEQEVRRHTLSKMLRDSGIEVECEEFRKSDHYMTRFEYDQGQWHRSPTESSWTTVARNLFEMQRQMQSRLPHPEIYRRRERTPPNNAKSTIKRSKPIRAKVPSGSDTPSHPRTSILAGQSSQSCSSSSAPVPTLPPLMESTVSPEDRFYADLVASMREYAHKKTRQIEDQIQAFLMALYTYVNNRGPCPSPISGIVGPPVCCNGTPAAYMKAGNNFIDLVMSMSNPEMIQTGMYGLRPDEVDAIRGIIVLRYIAGWYQEDLESGFIIPVEDICQGKGKGRAE